MKSYLDSTYFLICQCLKWSMYNSNIRTLNQTWKPQKFQEGLFGIGKKKE